MFVPQDDMLLFFQELYDKARSDQGVLYANYAEYNEQYEGTGRIFSDPAAQSATFFWNITRELIDSKRSTVVPAAKVTPRRWSAKGDRNARSIERLCASLRDSLPFERLNDLDESYTYIDGGSVWLMEWDESIRTHSTVGDVRITVIDPDDFTPQPNIYNVEDMEYCFVRFMTTREELCRRYGISRDMAELAGLDPNAAEHSDDENVVTVIACYYRDEEDKVCLFSWSDELVLADLHDYYARKRAFCRICGRREEICTCEEPEVEVRSEPYEELTADIILPSGEPVPAESPVVRDNGERVTERAAVPLTVGGMQVTDEKGLPVMTETDLVKMEPTRIPYYTPRRLPIVVRRNLFKRNALFGASDCEVIRPQQEQVNKLNTRIIEKLLRAGITPVMPEDARVAPDNSVFGQVIRLGPGESTAQYGIIDNTPNIAQDVAERQNQYEMAKRNIGITESYQGNADTTAKSGVAKQAQIAQSAGRLAPHRQQKALAYSEIDRVIFEFYLAYADEARPIAYKDPFGRIQNDSFRRYDFLEYDKGTGEWYFDDQYLFSADENGSVEQQRETMWQLNLQNLQSGAIGNPQDPATLLRYWQNQEREHYPHARENVEYFEALVERQKAQISAQSTSASGAPQNAGGVNHG